MESAGDTGFVAAPPARFPVSYAPVVSVSDPATAPTSIQNPPSGMVYVRDGGTNAPSHPLLLFPSLAGSAGIDNPPSAPPEHLFVTPVYPEELINNQPALTQEPDAGRRYLLLDAFDIPNCTTLSGTIIALHMLALCVSLFVCLARADFNFVVYLLGYHIWCLESRRHPCTVAVPPTAYPRTKELYVMSKQMLESVQFYTALLAAVALVDFSWLMLGSSAWLECDSGECDSAVDGFNDPSRPRRFQMTYRIHQFAIYASTLNFIAKIILVILSITWIVQQKRHHKALQRYGSSL